MSAITYNVGGWMWKIYEVVIRRLPVWAQQVVRGYYVWRLDIMDRPLAQTHRHTDQQTEPIYLYPLIPLSLHYISSYSYCPASTRLLNLLPSLMLRLSYDPCTPCGALLQCLSDLLSYLLTSMCYCFPKRNLISTMYACTIHGSTLGVWPQITSKYLWQVLLTLN